MKGTISFFIVAFIFITSAYSQELTGDDIVKKVNDLINVETAYMKAKMAITTTSGAKRTFTYESWAKDRGAKTLMRYIAPPRVKGQAILMLNNANDIWMYFPRTGRVRKLATHAKKQKMMDSDFSYEDMGSGDTFIDDFTAKRLKDDKYEGEKCYKVELTKKPDSDISYSRLIMWVRKKDFVPVLIEYYDENNPEILIKRLYQKDIRIIDGIPTAFKIIMKSEIENSSTEIELIDVKYDIQISDDMFTERSLKK